MNRKGRLPWGRVTVEFFVIMVGVLLALFADSIYDSSVERRLAEEYRVRVLSEVEEIQGVLDYLKAHTEAIQVETSALVPFFEESAVPTDSLRTVIQLYNSSRRSGQSSPNSAYEDLVATGNLRSFGDPELRSLLKRTYHLFSTIEAEALYANDYRQAVRQLIPLQVQIAVRDQCPGPAAGGLADCEIEVERFIPEPVFQSIGAQRDLVGLFRINVHELDTFLGKVSRGLETVDALRIQLSGGLNRGTS